MREACGRKGVFSESVVAQLEAELLDKTEPKENPAALPIPELAEYIVRTDHGFLWRKLPRLHAMSARVAQVHGGHTPSLIEVYDVFMALEDEMVNHMKQEEQVLFPPLAAISRNEAPPVPLDEPIACMIQEHESSGAALVRVRELTHGFRPPVDGCNTYRALLAGLYDLEEDLHRHIHLEMPSFFHRHRGWRTELNKKAEHRTHW